MRLTMVIFLVFFCLVSNVAIAIDTIPYRQDKYGRLLVPITTGDLAIEALFDTATTRLGLNERVAFTAGIEAENNWTIQHFTSASRLSLPVARLNKPLAYFSRIALTPVNGPVAALYASDTSADGIIGYDSYWGYIVEINPPQNHIHFHSSSTSLLERNWQSLQTARPDSGLFVLSGSVCGVPVSYILASGISKTVAMINREERQFAPCILWEVDNQTEVIMGMRSQPFRTYSLNLSGVVIDDWLEGDVSAGFVTDVRMSHMTWLGENLIFLGADFFKKHQFALDTRMHMIWYRDKSLN